MTKQKGRAHTKRQFAFNGDREQQRRENTTDTTIPTQRREHTQSIEKERHI